MFRIKGIYYYLITIQTWNNIISNYFLIKIIINKK